VPFKYLSIIYNNLPLPIPSLVYLHPREFIRSPYGRSERYSVGWSKSPYSITKHNWEKRGANTSRPFTAGGRVTTAWGEENEGEPLRKARKKDREPFSDKDMDAR